jgi:hypothetical protein
MSAIPRPFTIFGGGRAPGGIFYGANGQTITGNSSGAWAIAANGTNQNITLTPSGTGTSAGKLALPIGGTRTSYFGVDPGDANYHALWLGLTVAPTTLNYTLDANGTNLYINRPSASGDTFFAANGSAFAKFAATSNSLLLGTTTDSSNGRIQLATHTTSAGGVSWGTRAAEVVYRTANDTLRTDATWQLGRFIQAITDTRSGVGAVSVTADTTKLTSTGVAEAITLADGADGQIKRIVHDVDGGSMVLTPTTKTGFSTVTFTNAGDTVMLQFFTTRGWMVMANYGAVVAP